VLHQIPTGGLFQRDLRELNPGRAFVPEGHSSPCPFGHRVTGFQLESVVGVALVQRGPVRVNFNDDCKDTRAQYLPGLLLSIESFDAMLGLVQTH
jgi:hypothetical protein